ncbi:hypothetical protein [Paraburkholderia kirstenboschensis]|uniref:Uncharacterized protein n=1 Tax=Paraburkholderia kirstenboschensis TaxID=1245436 RepID=A0ABZ0EFD7_9BURK|nr:hypothetical protein [Paraburkholderia kirstenboschensis]WOD15949.1 hypothetical protein RW095_22225 [Paraburkholderia kirstenboschensis]
MANIEREFQFLAERILAEDLRWWTLKHAVITRFYALWELRARYSSSPVPAPRLRDVLPGALLSKDQKEILESKHYLYADDDGSFPSRQMTGLRIQFELDQRSAQLSNTQWRVCKAEAWAGEFLVPDRPTVLCIPLAPRIALVGNSDITIANADTLRFFNLIAAAGSDKFIFARDFSLCFPNRK